MLFSASSHILIYPVLPQTYKAGAIEMPTLYESKPFQSHGQGWRTEGWLGRIKTPALCCLFKSKDLHLLYLH